MAAIRPAFRSHTARTSKWPAAPARLIALCAALTIVIGASPAFAQSFLLGNRLDFGTGSAPKVVATGDFNGDGIQDMVVANGGANTISMLLGSGNGNFATKSDFTTGVGISAVVVGDFNGDGRLDVATSNNTASTVSVMLGNGAGGLGPRLDITCGSSPLRIAAGDLNSDGKLDLVTANYGANTVSVLLGNGNGTFAARVDYITGLYPLAVAVGDVNADGALDIVATNNGSDSISLLTGRGDGTFNAKLDRASGSSPYGAEIGDLSGDGYPDVVVASFNNSTVSVFPYSASGFGTRADYSVGAGGSGPVAVAVGDITGDGRPDVVASNALIASVSVLANNGSGGLNAASTFSVGSTPQGLAIEDMNGDGRRDVLVVSYGAGTVSVLFARGAGLMGPKTDYTVGTMAYWIASGDLNGDGKLDLVTPNQLSNSVSVLLGTGAGTFGAKTDFATGPYPMGVALADVNADGKLDIVATNNGANTVSVLLGTGTGSFGAKTDFAVGSGPRGLAVADVSGDGKPDIVAVNSSANTLSVLLGTGTGSFGAKTDFGAGATPLFVAIGDVNPDGYPDIVVANLNSNTVSVLQGTGGGAFATKVDYPTGAFPYSAALGDLNGDGKLDIAVTNNSSNTVSILLNTGTGSGVFAGKTDYVTGFWPIGVVISDVNGDGRNDVAAVANGANSISVLLGNGDGTLGAKQDAPVGNLPWGIATADFNGDGRLDIAVDNRNDGTVSVLLNPYATRATLSCSPAIAALGNPVTLSSVVTIASPLSGTPTGSVSFFDGTLPLGSATLVGGTAMLPVWASPPGAHAYSAVYSGTNQLSPRLTTIATLKVVTSLVPVIASVRDVRNDQGGKVRLAWNGSVLDTDPATTVDTYWLWRQVPARLAQAALAGGARLLGEDGSGVEPAGHALYRTTTFGAQTYYWEYLASVGAYGLAGYSYLAPTASDSVGGSNPYTLFMVQARKSATGEHWDSAPDSGYSVDNLPPVAPAPFAGQYAAGSATLHWNPNPEADLAGYRIYRGTSPSFTPSPANRIAAQADTGYVDAAGGPYYYKLTAVDVHGNEGPAAFLMPSGTLDVLPGAGAMVALAGARPNPARGGVLMVHFALPGDAPATLDLLDVSGRRVASRAVGALGAGDHAVDLAAGRRLAPGVYLVRLTQGTAVRTARVAVID
jgi:hypothetical protein